MAVVRVSASARIQVAPRIVYSILADYHSGHPQILQPVSFRDLVIERGGTGAGTVIRFQMTTLGTTRSIRAEISEPTDVDTGARTPFTVMPADGGQNPEVQIETVWTSGGLRGWIEHLAAPSLLRRIYAEELENLARLAEVRNNTEGS